MPDLPTFQELQRVARDEMLARNGQLTRAIIERDGSDTNLVVAAGAAIGDEAIGQLARVEAGLYLDSAKGTALDRLVFDRYGLVRKPASPATGSVEFRTTVASPSNVSIPVNTRLQTADGRQFATAVAATFPLGSVGPVSVAVRSVFAGLSQQARAGTITSIVSQLASAPADLVVSNTLATAGADDEEQDDSLRDRARRFFTTARRGTLAAIEAAALAVAGVRKATAFEALDAYGRPAKAVQLVVADAFTEQLVGVADATVYETQSQALAQAVLSGLDETRAFGIAVQPLVAVVVLVGVTLGLRFQAGVDPDAVALEARAVVVGTVNALAPGATLDPAALVAALRRVPGLVVTGQEIASPVGPVVAQPRQVLRATLALVVASSLAADAALRNTTNPDA